MATVEELKTLSRRSSKFVDEYKLTAEDVSKLDRLKPIPSLREAWAFFAGHATKKMTVFLLVCFYITPMLVAVAAARSSDASIQTMDGNNYSHWAAVHVTAFLVPTTILLGACWIFAIWLLHELFPNFEPSLRRHPLGVRMNWEMVAVYTMLGLFLNSAELLDWAPQIRYYNIPPYLMLVIIFLVLEMYVLDHDHDWRFAFALVPLLYMIFSAREAHLMMAGFSFSTLEMLFNAPPTVARGVFHILIFYVNYGFVIAVMTNYYYYWEVPLATRVNVPQELCFLAFIIPFRLPILYRREMDAQRMKIMGAKVPPEILNDLRKEEFRAVDIDGNGKVDIDELLQQLSGRHLNSMLSVAGSTIFDKRQAETTTEEASASEELESGNGQLTEKHMGMCEKARKAVPEEATRDEKEESHISGVSGSSAIAASVPGASFVRAYPDGPSSQ